MAAQLVMAADADSLARGVVMEAGLPTQAPRFATERPLLSVTRDRNDDLMLGKSTHPRLPYVVEVAGDGSWARTYYPTAQVALEAFTERVARA